MNQRAQVQKVIDEKSIKFGEQVSNLVNIAQPDPNQEIKCPHCWFGFLPNEVNIEPMDLDKITADITATLSTHIRHIVELAIIEGSNGTDTNNEQLVASLEKQRDAANETAQTLANEIDNITPMITALTFIASEISKTKQRTAISIQNMSPAEESGPVGEWPQIALAQGKTLDSILEKIHSVSPKPTQS